MMNNSSQQFVRFAFCFGLCLAACASQAQQPMAPRVSPLQRNIPDSVVLRGDTQSNTIQRLRVVRKYVLSDVRTNSRVSLGSAQLNFKPMLNNPKALFNVAQTLRSMPQIASVTSDQTDMNEIDQGLVVHHVLGYRILPGKCSDTAARAQLQNVGLGCFQSQTLASGIQGFSTPGNPRYVADAGKRLRAVAAYQDKVHQQEAEIAGHIADLRKQLADPAKRSQFISKFGQAEVDRMSRLNDDQLKAELINTGEQTVEQTLFIPKLDSVARIQQIAAMKIVPSAQETASLRQQMGGTSTASNAMALTPGGMTNQHIPAATITASDKITSKDLGSFIYLTGFTLGKDYEWRQGVSTTIKWCWIGCSATYSVEIYAGFSYGFGLRFPVQTHLDYKYILHGDNSEMANVKVDYAPINGSPADYAAAGLASDQIFSGKELVAQVTANAGINYNLPIVGSGGVGISVGEDFTQGLPAPFTNGQFKPPAPCGQPAPCPSDLDEAPIVFDNFDLLGGEGNFGVVGGQAFPAIEVGLHSDSLRFTLVDRINGKQTAITKTGQTVPLSVGTDLNRTSRFTLANPVYNLGFVVTPGIVGRVFVDLGVWSDHWDWPVWFPELTIELPPGGVDFGCHAGTICTRNFDVQGRTLTLNNTRPSVGVSVPPVKK